MLGLLLLLPAPLLVSAHADAGHAHHHGHHHETQRAHASGNGGGGGGWTASPWVQAFASTTLISVVPTLVLPLIPLAKRGADGQVALNEKLHKTLLSFAAGGLLGEVFLHSLPHLLEAEEAEEGEEHAHQGHSHGGHGGHEEHHHHGAAKRVSLWVLFGFLAFFAAEKLARVLLGEEGGHGHTHGHGHAHASVGEKKKAKVEDSEEEEEDDEDSEEGEGMDCSGSVDAQGLRRRSRRIRESHGRKKQQQRAAPGGAGSSPRKENSNRRVAASKEGDSWASGLGLEKLKASGYLNITLDLAHNLTDGIAIGASFAASASKGRAGGGGGGCMGLATTLSVLLHEVPHEIGDFSILVQSGMSLRAAFLMQFCTAIAAFVGTACGMVATRHEGLERVLVGLMSGGFLYVGAVSVLPELLAGKSSPWQAVREVGGVLGGIWLMTLVGHGH